VFGAPRHATTRALLAPADGSAPPLPGLEAGQALFAITQPAAAPPLELTALAAALGPGGRLLAGPAQAGRSATRLLLAAADADVPATLARLRAVAPTAEVLADAG
jgi:hypothetical protein